MPPLTIFFNIKGEDTMKQIKKSCLLIAACLFFTGCVSSKAHAELTLVSKGKSTFTIVVPAKVPVSVTMAAQELQLDVSKATKVQIPIKKDTEEITGSYISLGSTKQAKTVGITINGIADSGFRIVTKNGNLYIIGLDTAATQSTNRGTMHKLIPNPDLPGPQYTKEEGFSNGTANGVYTFLEDYLNVRWLMPGELGRDVPIKSTFTIPEINRVEEPEFILRDMRFLSGQSHYLLGEAKPSAAGYQWKLHQKLGSSFGINYTHNWMETVPADLYKTHPEWFAMLDGKRVPPTGAYKLETTNQELVKFYAEKAIAALKANPHMNTYSQSPSDGFRWSESPESKALYEPTKYGGGQYPSYSRLVYDFYHDVAAIVQKEYPQGKLAGFIYSSYLYPPDEGDKSLPENFIPVIAPNIDYFYGLYREKVRKEFKYLITTWSKVVPEKWFIYDEPNILYWYDTSGIITPPATDILNYYFSTLVKNGVDGMTTSGSFVWSQTALGNYIMARMMWNPHLDANDVKREWLARAYGSKAGAIMDQFYDKVSANFGAVWTAHRLTRYSMKSIYGDHYPEMEKLFLQAQAQPMTEMQKRRFNLIKINMIVLQWRLQKAGYLPDDFVSQLQRSGAQIEHLLFDGSGARRTEDNAFSLLPIAWYVGRPRRTVPKIKLNQTPPTTQSDPAVNVGYIQIYTTQDGEVNVKVDQVDGESAYVTYSLYPRGSSRDFRRGLAYKDATITFNAKANTLYLLHLGANGVYRPKLDYTLSIADASVATGSMHDGTLYLHGKENAPLYVHVSGKLNLQNTTSGVTISTESPVAAARAAALRQHPGSKVLLTLDTKWQFNTDPKKTGLQRGVIKNDYNVASWKKIDATDTWDVQGFPNYHGTAWYRKSFAMPKHKGKVLLFLGGVEGDAVVYLNGQKVGMHTLDEVGGTWEGSFAFDITNSMQPGKNVIAVQVTKSDPVAGIYKGVTLLEMPADSK